ncbi:MAG: tetratricopeptide repeat protein [Acidobacteriota bacterium]
MKGYATREVAQILGLSPAQVRSYVRAGFLRPALGSRGRFCFSFPDLVFLRTAKGLMEAHVPPRRIRGALRTLARKLPETERLTDVRIAAEGGRVVVEEGASRWQPESGQTLFDFGVQELAAKVEPLARRTVARALAEDAFQADDWYELGCELEAGAPEQARVAYERALTLDSGHAEAHVNLGRMLHESGDAAGAGNHYRAALASRPEDATAAFNLGVALEDLGSLREALAAYERALEIDPADADAHFNAANLSERLRDSAAALAHWKSYRRLTRPLR